MLIVPKTRKKGVMEYLLTGRMKGRSFTRDELDERIIFGDFDITDKLIKSLKYKQNYYHFTLSFSEKNIPMGVMKEIKGEFEKFICHGFSANEYNIYAEAHIPKIKYKTNEKTGEMDRRLPHIHFVIPRKNLITGTQLKVSETRDTRYFNAFQEYINIKYGLISPKDHLNLVAKSKSEIYESYGRKKCAATFFNEGTANEIKKKLAGEIEKQVKDKTLSSYEELLSFLEKQDGFVDLKEVKSKNGLSYLSVKMASKEKRMRLKGYLFDKANWGRKILERKIEKKSMHDYLRIIEQWKSLREKQIDKRYRKRREKEYLTITEIYREAIFQSGFDELDFKELGRIAYRQNLTGHNYKYIVADSLLNKKGFWIKKNYFGTMFKYGKWEIRDNGHIIKVNRFGLIDESVSVLLDLAQMKGWDLKFLKFSGEESFMKEMKKQIDERRIRQKDTISIRDVDNYIANNKIGLIDAQSRKLLREKIKKKIEEHEKKQKEKKMSPQILSKEQQKLEKSLNKSYYIKQIIENLELLPRAHKVLWNGNLKQYVIEDLRGTTFSLVEFVASHKNLDLNKTLELLSKEEGDIKKLFFYKTKEKSDQINKLHPSIILNKLHIRENIPNFFKSSDGVWLISYEEKYVPILKYYMEKTRQPFYKAVKDLEGLAMSNKTELKNGWKGQRVDIKSLKSEVNLVEFMAKYFGHGIHSTSTSRQKVFKGEGYRISVSQMSNGDWVYKNFDSIQDKGSILDFVKNRENVAAIPEVLKRIEEIEGRALPILREGAYSISGNRLQNKEELIKSAKIEWQKAKQINNLGFILNRGLDVELVRHIAKHHKTIRQDNKHALNFNLIDKRDGEYVFCGLAKFNRNFKKVQGQKGLWVSHKRDFFEKAKIIITETPVDGLAYMSMHKREKISCIATNGQYSQKALETLVSILNDFKIKEVTLAMDNDVAGQRFNKEIAERIKKDCPTTKIKLERPKLKDWNEDLLGKKNAELKSF